jgi:long-chain acyl-CoA synthetase
VGPPIPGVEVRLGPDDEVLVRGPNVFLGYYKDPLATAAALEGGWLHSGDLGKFDSEGFLQIIGRKKEILITAGGKNIAPRNIEEALKRHPWVAEAVIIGDRRPYLTALLCLDAEKLAAQGMSVEKAEVRQAMEKWVEKVNSEFARVEHIRRFEILPRLLSQEAGELTPTLKLKRNVIMRNWEAEIERLYAASTETS